jgi:hypothetical protein
MRLGARDGPGISPPSLSRGIFCSQNGASLLACSHVVTLRRNVDVDERRVRQEGHPFLIPLVAKVTNSSQNH